MSVAANAAKRVVVIVGAGPGLGAGVARAFAKQGHPVAIASRSAGPLEALANEINGELPAPKVKFFTVDATNTDSIRKLVEDAGKAWPEAKLHTGVWNPTAGFKIAPFTEWSEQDMRGAFEAQVIGAFAFTQAMLKHFLAGATEEEKGGVMLYTGATAALKGGEKFAGFAAAKAGLRMMVQSLAREHGRDGVHAAHFIIDGMIDTKRIADMMGPAAHKDDRLQPDDIAQQYLNVANQPRSVWTHEVDFRPSREKW